MQPTSATLTCNEGTTTNKKNRRPKERSREGAGKISGKYVTAERTVDIEGYSFHHHLMISATNSFITHHPSPR
jgi:hypothetical protein